MTAALGVLLVPVAAGSATAKKHKKKRYPVITSVAPMDAAIGNTLVIRGRNFKRGKNKNTVVFKADRQRAVFVKETLGTKKQVRVKIPEKLRPFITGPGAVRFRLRVFSGRFGKKFTSAKKSPRITAPPVPVTSTSPNPSTGAPTPAPAPAPAPVCVGDEDKDLLPASVENSLGLDPCKADTDEDGVPDGYEYQSARDLNDDEYQGPNTNLPYPGKRPYPNPLDKDDAERDHDGDSLTLLEEYRLWKNFGNTSTLNALLYSAGEFYSLSARDGSGRRRPTQPAATYAKGTEFLNWAQAHGYRQPVLSIAAPWYEAANQRRFWLFDFNRSSGDFDGNGTPDGPEETGRSHTLTAVPMTTFIDGHAIAYSTLAGYLGDEALYFDLDGDGYISDDERDEDADGLINYDEAHGRMLSKYWADCYKLEKPYPIEYAGTDLADPDTDGDGVRDGADDQDHDDVPNIMELSRNAASGYMDWGKWCTPSDRLMVRPFDENPDDDVLPEKQLVKVHHPDDYGRVNPYNPCLPFTWARTCTRYVEDGTRPAPFDDSPNWFALQ